MRICVLVVVGTAGLLFGAAPEPDDPPKPNAPATPRDPAEHRVSDDRTKQILDIAGRYTSFQLNNPLPQRALARCAPSPPSVHLPLTSHSDDAKTHGKKLYMLWVQDSRAYWQISYVDPPDKRPDPSLEQFIKRLPGNGTTPGSIDRTSPVGQTLVKETFEAMEVSDSEWAKTRAPDDGGLDWRFTDKDAVMLDGKRVKKGDPAELFIMTKVDPKTPDTDAGWIYAVVSKDRKSVLSAGRIESCIRCHETTGRDRLYGPEETWPLDLAGKHVPPLIDLTKDTPKKPTDDPKRP